MEPCFLLSLPRSGSTLVQRVLSQNSFIHTTGEPWIALMFPYALREEGVHAEYSHHSLQTAVQDFVSQLPRKEADYYLAAGEMIRHLQAKMAHSGSRYFLDKTPRYYLILDELAAMFPTGKFIVLYRNPLAVAASIIQTWKKGKFSFGSNEIDLYQGPQQLHQFARKKTASLMTLRYEDFVHSPLVEYNRIMDFLGLPGAAQVELPQKDSVTEAPLGDKKGILEYQSISKAPVENWTRTFNNPLRKRWAKKYLEFLEPSLTEMGYSRPELLNAIQDQGSLAHIFQDIGSLGIRALKLLGPAPIRFVPKRSSRQARLRFDWQ